jgi:hypothetical protein
MRCTRGANRDQAQRVQTIPGNSVRDDPHQRRAKVMGGHRAGGPWRWCGAVQGRNPHHHRPCCGRLGRWPQSVCSHRLWPLLPGSVCLLERFYMSTEYRKQHGLYCTAAAALELLDYACHRATRFPLHRPPPHHVGLSLLRRMIQASRALWCGAPTRACISLELPP